MLIRPKFRTFLFALLATSFCESASSEDFSETWTSWWRGCTPEALTECLRKSAGTSRAVGLGMNFECRVRFDRGYPFYIFVGHADASIRFRNHDDGERYKTYKFRGHRARLAIDKGLLIDQSSGDEITDGDFRKRVSDKTNTHIFETVNALLKSKGICESEFKAPEPNGDSVAQPVAPQLSQDCLENVATGRLTSDSGEYAKKAFDKAWQCK